MLNSADMVLTFPFESSRLLLVCKSLQIEGESSFKKINTSIADMKSSLFQNLTGEIN